MLEVAVHKRLDGFRLDVAFTAEHELVVLFGPSGSGKSLTLQAIAGTVQPEAGRIVIDGQTVYDSASGINLPPQARRVGYVPQHYALFPHLTAGANIAFGLADLPRGERERRVAELLTLFDLQGLERRRPHDLSGGQQQRVALARALAVQPQLLLLDEPFAALDAPLRGALRQELAQVQTRWGITTLLVTHDLADAFALGQRVIVSDGGRVIQQGTREAVFFRPLTRRVAEFVGTPGMNFIDGKFDGNLFITSQIKLPLADNRSESPRNVTLGIRPENIEVSVAQNDGWQAARVYVTELMGSETFVFLETAGQKIIARAGALLWGLCA